MTVFDRNGSYTEYCDGCMCRTGRKKKISKFYGGAYFYHFCDNYSVQLGVPQMDAGYWRGYCANCYKEHKERLENEATTIRFHKKTRTDDE